MRRINKKYFNVKNKSKDLFGHGFAVVANDFKYFFKKFSIILIKHIFDKIFLTDKTLKFLL